MNTKTYPAGPPCPKCSGPTTVRRKGPGRTYNHCAPCMSAAAKRRRIAKGWVPKPGVPADRKTGDPCEPCPKCGGDRTWYNQPSNNGWSRVCRPCNRAKKNDYYQRTAPARVEYQRNYYQANPEYRARSAEQTRKSRQANPEKLQEQSRRWNSTRRARLAGVKSDGLTLSLSPNAKCYICLGAPVEHVDHVVPLAQGGSDLLSNKAGACGSCNTAKSAHVWPGSPGWDEFVQKRRGART